MNGNILPNHKAFGKDFTTFAANFKKIISIEALEILKNLDDPEFNIFDLNEHLKERTIMYLTQEVFSEKGYFDHLI